jgi:membrane protein implicated in regulation of membrane protease activity
MSDLEVRIFAWVAIAVAAGIVEVARPHLGSVFVAIGATAAAVATFLGYGFLVQSIVFVIFLVVSLGVLRAHLTGQLGGRGVPSRTEPLIGRQGVVTHAIDPVLGTGRVTVGGEDWAAKSVDAISTGTTIRVVAADGIVLEVRRV